MDQGAEGLSVEVFFDLVCPWCFIGKRELDAALQRFAEARPGTAIRVRWRSFPLLPDTPPGGLDYASFYEQRLGGPAAVAARRAQVQDAARAAGLQFHFERIRRLPNTFLAHALVQHAVAQQAAGPGTGSLAAQLIERLFDAYFVEGQDIGDPDVLAALAAASGVDGGPPLAQETEAQRQARLNEWWAAGTSYGITSVPSVSIAGTRPLVGAVPAETLLQALIAASRPVPRLVRTEDARRAD